MLISQDLEIFGKWVLVGEHTVLRGGRAIVFPHPKASLQIRFVGSRSEHPTPVPSDSVQAAPALDTNTKLRALLFELLRSLQVRDISESWAQRVEVQSTIPTGGGQGSSAALCVAAVKLSGVQDPAEILRLATCLEDRFHGKSSGMDIAAVLSQHPLEYAMAEGGSPLDSKWDLNRLVTFVDTRHRMATAQAIRQVDSLWRSHPGLAAELDAQMRQAFTSCKEGLVHSQDMGGGLEKIASGMRLAHRVFEGWNLVPEGADRLVRGLYEQGALAVKLTGAGGGGFLVALWPEPR